MAKKASSSSRKSLKSLFSRSEASLDGTADKDVDKTEGDKKKFKLFKLRTKSRSGSAAEKGALEEQRARSAVESDQPAEDETWMDDMAYRDKLSLYATAPRSKDKEISYSELDLHKPKKFATLSFGLKKKKKKYEDNISKSTFVLHVPEPEESSASTTPLPLSRAETGGDELRTRRLLSLSQPELDTSDAFDIPSPPPVVANRFEPGFSALNQLRPTASFNTHERTQEPPEGPDQTVAPDDAPRAPIATIPELQMNSAASEESISAHGNATQSHLAPTATAPTGAQTTPIGPAERPQVDLDPSGQKEAVLESVASTVAPQKDVYQHSATTETSGEASIRGERSHDQAPAAGRPPELGSASAPGESSASEAVPAAAVSRKKSPRPVNQDEVYGALYDSLFPQSFTSEVLSSLSTSSQVFSEPHQSKAVVWAVNEYRTETRPPSHPGQTQPAAGREDPAGLYGGRDSVSGHFRLTSHQTEPEASKASGVHSTAPPASRYSRLESGDGGKPLEGLLLLSNLQEDSPGAALQVAAPPASDCGTAPGGDAPVTEPVPAPTPVRHFIREQASTRPASPSPAPENKTRRNPERKSQGPAPPGDMEGFFSPTYLSVGSDDGSAVDIYYSAEEDNMESGDDEMYTMDEGGAQMEDGGTTVGFHKELEQQGGFSARDEGAFRGTLVQKSGGETKEEGQARGHGFEAHLQDNEKWPKAMAQMEEEGTEVLAKPVLQGNEAAVCDPVPPFAEKCLRLEDSQQIWARELESEEPPNGEQRSVSLPLDYLTHKSRTSDDARQEVIITVRSATAGKQVSTVAEAEKSSDDGRQPDGRGAAGAAVDTGSVTHRGSAAQHNRVPQSAEWVDTITWSTGRSRNPEAEVQLHLTDAHRAAAAAAAVPLSGSPEHPSQGSVTTSGKAVLALGLQPTKPGWMHKMDSGYSSLSTTLSLKNFPEDDAKRFHKLSLIDGSEADGATSIAATETNGEEHKWKNRFEGVFQYKAPRSEGSFLSDGESDGSKATTCRYLDTSSSVSSHPLEPNTTSGNRLSSSGEVCTSGEGGQRDECRRSSSQWEEPAAPAEREGAALRLKSLWQQPAHNNTWKEEDEDEDSARFTGVFQATLVELDSDPVATPSTPPASPDSDSLSQFEMDNLVDTLKSMGPSTRPRSSAPRPPAPALMSSLPPIVEDSQSPASQDAPDFSGAAAVRESLEWKPAEPLNGLYTLPPDLGLRSSRDTRSLLNLMKQNQQEPSETPGSGSPLRTAGSAIRTSPDFLPDDVQSQVLNGNELFPAPNLGSRLDSSVLFGRSVISDQKLENKTAHRSLFRTSSLPDVPFGSERLSIGAKELESGSRTDPAGSRYERFSVLLNTSTPGSLNGAEDASSRISRPPQASLGSPPSSNSPTHLLSPTGSIDLHRPFASPESSLTLFGQAQAMGIGAGRVSAPILQRSFSSEASFGVQQTPLFSSVAGETPFGSQGPQPEKNLPSKYRAFPDAYLTKEKEHGKLNPRPGKVYIFDRPGMCGQRFEVRSDVIDATPWELQETISIRVTRGGWVLYEKPNFKGEKFALDEGDIEITCPFGRPEHQQNGHEEGVQNGPDEPPNPESAPKFIIGSIRRAVRDYSVPEISLFPEENAEGKKVVFRDTSEDARIFGLPVRANSIIVNAGLWLVYAQPSFQGAPRVLEVGGYSNPAAWGVDQPYVGSLHPLKIGEPRVENASEPKMVIYDKPYFTGKSRTITSSMRDFMTRTDSQQTTFMYSVGSLKVLGGIWVGFEKEGYRGHQYLLEEGEYHDWRVWGGCDSELRSVRVIRADLSDPLLVMFELPEDEDEGEGEQEGTTFEVTEAIPDVELFNYKTNTRSIHVLSGAWVAYSHVDFSGNQYILEKGFYNNCADWGSQDNRICSLQPILMAHGSQVLNEVILYSEPNFQGESQVFDRNQDAVPEKLLTKSCRVSGGSWVIYEEKNYSGSLYVLSEGDYPNLSSMGCPSSFTIRSVKAVAVTFTVPSISLFSLECLEGREITTETEITSMVEEGFNNHILSVRVNSGCWVICEHSNYRGRQFFLEPIEITNWLKFSSLQTVGSLFPVRQKRRFFRIRNGERGQFMSVQGGVDEMKSGRVVVSAQVEPMSDIWYYQDGLVKNKLISTMSLQVMGNIEPGSKAILWSETRQPVQTWTTQIKGLINSVTFPGMVLDVKGGKTYDKDHVVIMPENEERPSQQWEIELL